MVSRNLINITDKLMDYRIRHDNGENFRHASCVFTSSNKILSFGTNYLLNDFNKYKKISMHAEESVIHKLEHRKKPIKVNILVIRLIKKSQSYESQNSLPCLNCLQDMYNARNKGYNIKYVYYSDENGDICRDKLPALLNTSNYKTRFYHNLEMCHGSFSSISVY
jgi:cytidine deaminase